MMPSDFEPHRLDILRGHNPSRFVELDSAELYNMYIYNNGLVATPGFKRFNQFDFKNGAARSIFLSDALDKILVVYGSAVFLINDGLTFTEIGAFETLQGEVSVSENHFNQIFWSDLKDIWVYNHVEGTFSKAVTQNNSKLNFTTGRIDFQDTRAICNDITSKKFFISQLNNAATWEELDSTVDNQIASITVGIAVLDRQVLLMGDSITDVYYDQGLPNFPYRKANTVSHQYGCLSRSSIAVNFGRAAWLATNKESSPVIVSTTGGRLEKISTENIDDMIDAFVDPQDCDGYFYQVSGHIFYQLNFFTDKVSLLYDFATKLFSVVTDENLGLYPIKDVVKFNNTHYGINYNDGRIYEINTCFSSNDGKIVRRQALFPTIEKPKTNIECNSLVVDIGQGNNKVEEPAKFFLKISRDRGATFAVNQVRELAPTGSRNALLDFTDLGMGRFWTFGIEIYTLGEVVIREITAWIAYNRGQD